MSDIIQNLENFFRRMRLKSHFLVDDPESDLDFDLGSQTTLDQTLTGYKSKKEPIWKSFKPKSDYIPPAQEDILESFCKQVKFKVLKTPIKKIRWSNLSRDERRGLDELKNNRYITIKKADKGSAIVIMNTEDYVREAEYQLSNAKAYQKLDSDPSETVCREIQQILDHMLAMHVIDHKCHKYLSPVDPRPGRFYLLPKIHKKGVPGRPICSSNGHPTENISRFVDAHIRKFMSQNKSYVRDTQHFIQKLNEIGPLPEDAIIATLDVTSLYTNIPNLAGIKACVKAICLDPDLDINPNYLIKLLGRVLMRNYFTFNGQMYLQIGGTAMGTPIAPSYANTFMSDHESNVLESHPAKPFCWLRFLDDVFVCGYTGDRKSTRLNSSHRT
jgi:hypothetical protein